MLYCTEKEHDEVASMQSFEAFQQHQNQALTPQEQFFSEYIKNAMK